MLQNTFLHLPGVGGKTEEKFWDHGLSTWREALNQDALPVGKAKQEQVRMLLEESAQRLEQGDALWFGNALPTKEQWRLFPAFRHSAAYVDIETTGMTMEDDHITTIALYDGTDIRTYVYGDNLDDFQDDIREYKMIVTYNGRCFDGPFIERYFQIKLNMAHMDLRFVLKAAGVSGGLKNCEKEMGLDRGDLAGVDGFDAVLLWREYDITKDERALRTLLAYNIEDVINLEWLAVAAYNRLIASTPFAEEKIENPLPPSNPLVGDRLYLDEVREKYQDVYRGPWA